MPDRKPDRRLEAATEVSHFEIVLRELSLAGRDALTRTLDSASLAAARLASHSLCDLVDESLCAAKFTIRPSHALLFVTTDLRSPLWRWPRLSELTIVAKPLEPPATGGAGVEVCSLLTLPLLRQPPECLQRIQRLRLGCSARTHLPPAGLAPLLHRLPNLDLLDVWLQLSESSPLQQVLLYDTLACALSRLTELQLPTIFLLKHAVSAAAVANGGGDFTTTAAPTLSLTPLADRLRSLSLYDSGDRPNHEALAQGWLPPALCRMRGLRSLHLGFDEEDLSPFYLARLGHLLNSLPASLDSLTLGLRMLAGANEDGGSGNDGDDTPLVKFTLEAGQIVTMDVESGGGGGAEGAVLLECFASFVGTVLLPSSRLASKLRRLRLCRMELHDAAGIPAEQLQHLQALARRAKRVEVSELRLRVKMRGEVAVSALEALGGALPQRVEFFEGHEFVICTALPLDGGGGAECTAEAIEAVKAWSAAVAGGMLSHRQTQEAFLTERVMHHWLPSFTAAAAGDGDSAAAVAAAAAASCPAATVAAKFGASAASAAAAASIPLVVLRGPFFRVLNRTPDARLTWMRRLEKEARSAAEGAAAGTESGHRRSPLALYIPITSSAVVLMICWNTAGAAAMAEAAQRLLGAEGAGGSAFVTVAAHPLALHASEHGDFSWRSRLRGDLLKVIQEFWDSGVGGSRLERVRLLVDLGFLAGRAHRHIVGGSSSLEETAEEEE